MAKVAELHMQGCDQYSRVNSGYQVSFIPQPGGTLRPLTGEVTIISIEG